MSSMSSRRSQAFQWEIGGSSGNAEIDAATALLAEKQEEVSRLKELVQQAEDELRTLKTAQEEDASTSDGNSSAMSVEASAIEQELNADHEAEIAEIQWRHQEEVKRLKTILETAKEDNQRYHENHIAALRQEKKDKVDSMKEELRRLETEYAGLSTETKRTQNILYNTRGNGHDKVSFLESQLSEITAITRTELQDIKMQIAEVMETVDIRTQEYKNETAYFEKELEDRKVNYQEHIAALDRKNDAELSRLRQELDTATETNRSLQQMLKGIEREHEKRMNSALKDLEKLRTSTRTKQETLSFNAVTTKAAVTRREQREREQLDCQQELRLIENEIEELTKENASLKTTLQRLDKQLYG